MPQLHAPAAEQLSVAEATHAAHAAPATPHVANCDAVHVAPAQHPLGQLLGVQPVHTPPSAQFCADGHAEHAEPPPPQAPLPLPGSHVPFEQHPLGQEVPLQTHAPFRHTCPFTQAGPEPHVQTPALEHRSASVPQVTHATPAVPHAAADATSHTLPRQQPVGHEPLVQVHVPPTHAWP